MRIPPGTALCLLGFFSDPALAEVTDAAATGFTTVNEVTIDATADVAWQSAIEGVGL